MKKFLLPLLFLSFIFSNVQAEKSAEQMVASKKKADMTYKELMAVMGRSSAMMHEGILRENKQMVEVGAHFILNHPAPNHKPWMIMKKEDHKGFKQSLMHYDKILDVHTNAIVKAAKMNKWDEASKASNELMNSCIACHTQWRAKVK